MAAAKGNSDPRFTREQVRELEQQCKRLTPAQIEALGEAGCTVAQARALNLRVPSIARRLMRPPAVADVRAEIESAREHLRAVQQMLDKTSSRQDDPRRVALGYLGEASGLLGTASDPAGALVDPDDGTQPEVADFAALVGLAVRIADIAVSLAPAKGIQRRGKSDLAGAVSIVMEALRVPNDPASRALAQRVRPVRQHSVSNPFAAIASIAFDAAGATTDDLGAAVRAFNKRYPRDDLSTFEGSELHGGQ